MRLLLLFLKGILINLDILIELQIALRLALLEIWSFCDFEL